MPRRPSTTWTLPWIALAVTVALGGAVVVANGLVNQIDRPADARSRAERMVRSTADGDAVSVFNVGELRPQVAAAVASAAADAGGSWAPVRGASIGLVSVRRGEQFVQQAPAGFRYPLVVTAMEPWVAQGVLGGEVASGLADGSVVMGERTARLRAARVGDTLDVVAADGSLRALRVAQVVPDAEVGGAEVVMSVSTASSIGVARDTRAVMWGFASRTSLDSALATHGLSDGLAGVRVLRSWDPPNPDSTLSTARTKELLGEFAYRVNSDGWMSQDEGWVTANLPAGRELLNDVIRIRARCHVQVAGALRAALADVAAAGLAGAIDVGNTNTYGGCHAPRFNRISGELGFVSRHAWAMALDVNTLANCQGCVPRLDCNVVRIFRRHGFAWGGNFLVPDGMHFEWVGERRDQLAYPSRYCPNLATVSLQADTEMDSRDRLFADETLATEHDH